MAQLDMLAIDLGASSGRGIVGSFDGRRLTLRENHRFSNDPVSVNGTLYWDILRIFYEIKQSISKCILNGDRISSIGIDTWGVDYAYLDNAGRMLSNPVHYRDTRTEGMMQKVSETLPLSELYATTGIQLLNFNTVFQLAADLRDRPELVKEGRRILNIPDLLNYFLTGNAQNEYTILSTGALLDVHTRDYAYNVMERLQIPTSLFGPVIQPAQVVGTLLPSIQEELGKTDAKVLSVASHDTASAVIAVPTVEDDFIYISSGTWSLMGTELKQPLVNADTEAANFTNEGGAMGTIRFLKNIMGLWLIQESRRQWKREGKDFSFAQLEAMARESRPFKCLIVPDDSSFSAPGNMPERIRDFCRRTGQEVPKTEGEVIRCIYESLSLCYRQTAETICRLTGKQMRTIHVVGGGTKDTFLCRMTADACGIPVIAGPQEATAIGNLMMQAIGVGAVADLKHARQIVADSFTPEHYEPCADREPWERAYERFCALH